MIQQDSQIPRRRIPWPWCVTLTLSLHSWVVGSAHRVNEGNIWQKFNENCSKGSGDTCMERWNWRVNYMTLKCDLDLESAQHSHGFCTPSHWEEHLREMKILSIFVTLSFHPCGLKSNTLACTGPGVNVYSYTGHSHLPIGEQKTLCYPADSLWRWAGPVLWPIPGAHQIALGLDLRLDRLKLLQLQKAVLNLGLIPIASLGPRTSTKVESHVNFTESQKVSKSIFLQCLTRRS